MLKGSLAFRQLVTDDTCVAGEYVFELLAKPTFDGLQIAMFPSSEDACRFAEGTWGLRDKDTVFSNRFDTAWRNRTYRLDITGVNKFKTTLLNAQFATKVAVAYNALKLLATTSHKQKQVDTFSAVWTEEVSREDIRGTCSMQEGRQASFQLYTDELSLKLNEKEDEKQLSLPLFKTLKSMCPDYPRVTSFDWLVEYFSSLEEGTPNVVVGDSEEQEIEAKNEDTGLNDLSDLQRMLSGLGSKTASTMPKLVSAVDKLNSCAEKSAKKPKKTLPPEKQAKRVLNVTTMSYKATPDIIGAMYLQSALAKDVANVVGVYETIEDVIDAHPEKNTTWINNCKYEVVTDETLDSVMEELNLYEWIAFDTETSGLSINFYSRRGTGDQLVGVCLSGKENTGYYFPVQHKLFENICGGDHTYFMERYMKPLLETKKVICHNLSFDWKVAYIYDINVNCVYDTLLALGVTKRYEFIDFPLGLKENCATQLGKDMFEIEDFIMGTWKGSGITFADLPYELVRRYAPADADITLQLKNKFDREKLLENYEARRVFDLEVNFAKVVAYSEFWGYRVDTPAVGELQKEIEDGISSTEHKLFEMAGHEFNPNSPPQLVKIMYEDMGIPVIGDKKKTDKDTLKTLGKMQDLDGNPTYPFASLLLEYRSYATIYKNFLKKLHLFTSEEGFIFPKVHQLGTDTGRVSITEPNYQSYNDAVKKRIIPREGCIMFDSDFAQIEYRVLASMAGEVKLIEAFQDPDLDYHTYQASRMFSVPYASVTKTLRQQSKGINFGLPYGMGDASLGARIYGARTAENTAKAAYLRKKFFEGQENIERFFAVVRDNGVAEGYTSTWLGRRRYYHRGTFSVSSIRRQAGNHVIQGSAADVYKIAVCRLFNRVIKEGWLGKVFFDGFIHDELLGECSVDINPYEFLRIWREEYQVSIENFCTLYAGFGWGRNWYEAKKGDYPPIFIQELIDRAGTPEGTWDEDIPSFVTGIKEDLDKHEQRRIIDFCSAKENQGTIIKPVIYSYLQDKVDAYYPKGSNKYGLPAKKLDLNQCLELFAEAVELSSASWNILPPDTKTTAPEDDKPIDEEQLKVEQMEYTQRVGEQVMQMGYTFDAERELMFVRLFKEQSMQQTFVSNYCQELAEGDYRLVWLTTDAEGTLAVYPTNFGIPLSNLMTVCRDLPMLCNSTVF